jgi:hypothetical protein
VCVCACDRAHVGDDVTQVLYKLADKNLSVNLVDVRGVSFVAV